MEYKENIMEIVEKSILNAKRSADLIVNKALPNCDASLLAYLNGEIAYARGVTSLASNIFPDDKKLLDLLVESHGHSLMSVESRKRFELECICKKK